MKELVRFRVEFADGTKITLKAKTEEEAYKLADKMCNYKIIEIWED